MSNRGAPLLSKTFRRVIYLKSKFKMLALDLTLQL